jgi:hypothetical protein
MECGFGLLGSPKVGHYRFYFDSPRGGESSRSAGVGSKSVSGWFTEGFDTPDLKEAKALLDELGRQA